MFKSLYGSSHQANSQMAANQQSGLQNAYNQNQAASAQHAANMYAQQFQHANAAMQKNQHRYMINGVTMTWTQFLDELAPGDDNPMRTFLILKYKEQQ